MYIYYLYYLLHTYKISKTNSCELSPSTAITSSTPSSSSSCPASDHPYQLVAPPHPVPRSGGDGLAALLRYFVLDLARNLPRHGRAPLDDDLLADLPGFGALDVLDYTLADLLWYIATLRFRDLNINSHNIYKNKGRSKKKWLLTSYFHIMH